MPSLSIRNTWTKYQGFVYIPEFPMSTIVSVSIVDIKNRKFDIIKRTGKDDG